MLKKVYLVEKDYINGITTKELSKFKKVLKKLSSYISSLIDIGYGAGTDKAIATVLVIASILLSIASGYTTFHGLAQYTPEFIAFLIMLGVQGLLFGVSWKLGQLYVVREINPAMWTIWFITVFVSIFFSYSSLLDSVYSKEERRENREIESVTLGGTILKRLENDLEASLQQKTVNIDTSSYSNWKEEVVSEVNSIVTTVEKEVHRRTKEYEKLKGIYNKELNFGGTKYKDNRGRMVTSSSGVGNISNEYKQEMESYGTFELEPYRTKAENLIKSREIILENIALFETSKNLEALNNVYMQCVNMTKEFGGKVFNCSYNTLDKHLSELNVLSKVRNDFINSCSNEKVLGGSFEENIQALRKCIRLASIQEEKTKKYLIELNHFQKNEGQHAHFFVVAISELIKLSYLAVGSLILAIAIDLLILLCSLVASKHNTFLSISDAKELQQMNNYPLEIILGTNITIEKNDPEMIRRMKELMVKGTFKLEYAKKSYSMVISMDDVKEIGLHKELGTFFTMDLAKPFDNGKIIGFRTNFILWMCEQISKKSDSMRSYNEFNEAFSGDLNGK